MTRQDTSTRPRGKTDTALLRPLPAARNLTSEVVQRLSEEIRSGRREPGSRLPTESVLMAALGVSRTVVREAVSALKAEGLVTTRQGSGAFVSTDMTRSPFRIESAGRDAIAAALAVMELRLAVEVEAAALAATRVTAAQLKTIDKALVAMDAAIAIGDSAVGEDFAFHQAIAMATGNPHFKEFLRFLGHHIIPRQSLRGTLPTDQDQGAYLKQIQNEHRAIAEAISKRDAAQARRTMRRHIENSLARYRRVANSADTNSR